MTKTDGESGATDDAAVDELVELVTATFNTFLNTDFRQFDYPDRTKRILARCQALLARFWEEWSSHNDSGVLDQFYLNETATLAHRIQQVTEGSYSLSGLYMDLGLAVSHASRILGMLDTRLTGYHSAGFSQAPLEPEEQSIHDKLQALRDSFDKLGNDVTASSLLADADLARYAAEQAAVALEQVTESAAAASETAEHVQEAAGTTGTAELAAGFDAYATKEHRRTLLLRGAAIAFAALAVAVVVWVLRTLNPQDALSAYFIRLSLTLPLLGFSAYFLREATHARADAAEARRYAVRLKLIRAYTDDLEGHDKRRLRAQFGEAVFLGTKDAIPPASADANGAAKVMDAAANILNSARGPA